MKPPYPCVLRVDMAGVCNHIHCIYILYSLYLVFVLVSCVQPFLLCLLAAVWLVWEATQVSGFGFKILLFFHQPANFSIRRRWRSMVFVRLLSFIPKSAMHILGR